MSSRRSGSVYTNDNEYSSHSGRSSMSGASGHGNDYWEHQFARKQEQAELARRRADYHQRMRDMHARKAQAYPGLAWWFQAKAMRHHRHHRHHARRAEQHDVRHEQLQLMRNRQNMKRESAAYVSRYGR